MADVVRAFLEVSLRRRTNVGPLAWLTEIPRLASGVGAAPSAIVGGAVLATSLSVASASTPREPDNLAFVAPTTQASTSDAPSTTTSGLPATVPAIQDQPLSSTTTSTFPSAVTSEPDTTSTAETSGTSESPSTDQDSTTTTPAGSTTTTQLPTTSATTTTTIGSGLALDDDAFAVSGNSNHKLFVLANDDDGGSGFDLDTLAITTDPSHAGQFEVKDDHIRYQIENDYLGPDFLSYRICNNNGECQTANVLITVIP